ncbi:titin-like [Penaeus chinensis]|uniref:titin-like n=1 Tax=Penaeus chinensis TaxID=139456 RepID=UPI001FB7B73C|nr:titin-like [Penaeus chinensis]
MRGAILWLLGVAAVASLPLSDPPHTEQELMQLLLDTLPGENDLEGDVVKGHPEADVLSVPVTTQSSVNVTSKVPSDPAGTVPADDASTLVVTTPEQGQVQQQQQQVAEEDHEQVTEQEQMPEEVEQVLEQERAPEQEQQVPEEVTLPEQEQVPEEVQQVPQQEAEEPIAEQEQLPVEPQANPLVPVPVQESSRVKYFIPDTDEEPEIVYIPEEPLVDIPEEPLVDIPEEPLEDGFVAEEFPKDIVDVPEDNSEEPMDVFIVPEDVPEGFVPEDVPEGFVPEETYDGPEEIPEEIYENPDVPEEAFSVPQEVSDDLEYMPEEVFEGSEDFPQEMFGVPEEVPEVFIDNFGTPEEVFDGPQEMPEEFSDAEEEVPEGILIVREDNFDTFEDASADIFDGLQETPEAEISAGMFDTPEEIPGVFGVPEEFPQEVPEGFYDIREEIPEGMFVPEEVPQVDGPQDIPEGFSDGAVPVEAIGIFEEVPEDVSEDAFDGPQGAPEGFFDAPEQAYPEPSPLIPELVPIRVSYMSQEFIETREPEEDSEEDELVNVEPQEYPQEETYDQPMVYFVPEGETFVPENADYTPEEEYNLDVNSGMEQDMPQMDEGEYIPDDAPIASDSYYVGEEQPMIEDGAFMPEDEIFSDEAMPDNVNLYTPEGDVIIPGFLPDMSEETSSEEDVPEQFYPQGEESEGEDFAPFPTEADNDEMVFKPFSSLTLFHPAVVMGPETEGEKELEGDESSEPYVPPTLVEIVVIDTQVDQNDRLPLPFADQRPFFVQMQSEQLPVRPITPIAGETFRPDEPLPPIAEEAQTDEADQLTPIVVDNQTFLIPNENDSQMIFFPEDKEPTQSLPVFPDQWDNEKHFFLPIRSEDDGDDQPLTEENFPEFEGQQQPTQEFLEQSFPFHPQLPMRRPTFPTVESQDYFDGPQTPQRFGHFHPEPIPFQDDDSDDDDIIYPDYDMPAGHNFDYFMQSRYPQLYGRNGFYPQSINEPSRNLDFTPQNYQIYGPSFGQQSNSPSQFSPFNFRNAMPARSPYRQGYQGPFQFYSGQVAPQSQYETNYGYPWNYNNPSHRPVW